MLSKQLYNYTWYLTDADEKLGLEIILQALTDQRPNDIDLFEPVLEIFALNLRDIRFMINAMPHVIRTLPEFKAARKAEGELARWSKEDLEWLRIKKEIGDQAADDYYFSFLKADRQRGVAWNIDRFDKSLVNISKRLHEFADLLKQEGYEEAFKDAGPYRYHIPNAIGVKNFLRFRELDGNLSLDDFMDLFDILVPNALKEWDIFKQFANGETPDTSWYMEYKRVRVEEDGDHYAESLIQYPVFHEHS